MKQITVAAAVILNRHHQLLLVRKRGTRYFMQVGGKLEPHETPAQAMVREIQEEIGCSARVEQFIGRFETPAANEPDHQLISYVYQMSLEQQPSIAAEIAEMKWIDLNDETTLLAPLTWQVVLPWCRQFLSSKTS